MYIRKNFCYLGKQASFHSRTYHFAKPGDTVFRRGLFFYVYLVSGCLFLKTFFRYLYFARNFFFVARCLLLYDFVSSIGFA